MSFLLDTCVVSEYSKPVPSAKVLQWIDGQPDHDLFISAITFGEIQKGITTLPHGRKRRTLETFLKNTLETFDGRILPLDREVCLQWGTLRGQMQLKGQLVPVVDAFLAATVLTHRMTFVTRNVADFERTGVEILNPWE